MTIMDRLASRLNHHSYDESASVLNLASDVLASCIAGAYDGIELLHEDEVDEYRDWLKAKRKEAELEPGSVS